MKVAVVAPTSQPPVVGGAERLYEGLVEALDAAGHDAHLVTVPSPEFSFGQLVSSYRSFAELDLSEFDHVISTKYPSWMVRHRSHSVYMLHTLRGLYDTYHLTGLPTAVGSTEPVVLALLAVLRTPPGTPGVWRTVLRVAQRAVDTLGDDHPALAFPGPLSRALIHWLDQDALAPRNVAFHAANSGTVAGRAGYFPPGVRAVGIPHPSSLRGLHGGPFESLFTASRLDEPKRLDLVIAAMRLLRADVQLRIAGVGPDAERLRALAAGDDRIVFLGRVSEEQLVEEYSTALAVPFVPLDEDMGLVTIEAHLAGKPVITCTDSGGVTDLVRPGVDGLTVEPEPAALAEAMAGLVADRALARRMGEAGRQAAEAITWQPLVEALLPPFAPRRSPTGRRRAPGRRGSLVMLSTYPIKPARHGGQLRANRLAAGLARRFDVTTLVLDPATPTPVTTEVAPGLVQTLVGVDPAYHRLEGGLAEAVPVPVGDVAAAAFIAHAPEFLAVLADAVRTADAAVLAHPYLLPALERVGARLPVVYDAHNAETVMKRAMYGSGPEGVRLARVVEAVERAAVRRADLISVCSEQDRESLGRLGPTQADWLLVPNGSDVGSIPFVTGSERSARRERWLSLLAQRTGRPRPGALAIFVGSYHKPNLDAAEVVADLAARLPDVAFLLLGGVGRHLYGRRLPPNLVLTGIVGDTVLRSVMAAADVGLNPMLSGGGTNLKLIEYFAAGLPVVSTEQGVRGIDVTPGREVLVAVPEDFAAAVRATLDDPEAARHRAWRARALAHSRYDWRTLAAGLAAAVSGLLGDDSPSLGGLSRAG